MFTFSHLDVPRRSSNITCSSTGSSYLERRDSAITLGLPAVPGHKCKFSRRPSSPLPEFYDFYYPIDIRVTQPTPGGSPCGSDRALYGRMVDSPNLKPKLAPLASISSCNSSLGKFLLYLSERYYRNISSTEAVSSHTPVRELWNSLGYSHSQGGLADSCT